MTRAQAVPRLFSWPKGSPEYKHFHDGADAMRAGKSRTSCEHSGETLATWQDGWDFADHMTAHQFKLGG